jgi:hypothetical protein
MGNFRRCTSPGCQRVAGQGDWEPETQKIGVLEREILTAEASEGLMDGSAQQLLSKKRSSETIFQTPLSYPTLLTLQFCSFGLLNPLLPPLSPFRASRLVAVLAVCSARSVFV